MTHIESSKEKSELSTRPKNIFEEMRNEMNRVLQRFEGGWPHWASVAERWPTINAVVPELDVRENDKEIVVEAELPGVDEKDISVTFNNGYLTIQGEKKAEREEKKENYLRREFNYHSFKRSFRLPETVDQEQIRATHESGILTLSLPRKEEAVQNSPRQIAVE